MIGSFGNLRILEIGKKIGKSCLDLIDCCSESFVRIEPVSFSMREVFVDIFSIKWLVGSLFQKCGVLSVPGDVGFKPVHELRFCSNLWNEVDTVFELNSRECFWILSEEYSVSLENVEMTSLYE